MLIIWPAVVLFTIAALGLPAGMGPSLWTSTLFASVLGFEEPLKTSFITMFVALYGGIPERNFNSNKWVFWNTNGSF